MTNHPRIEDLSDFADGLPADPQRIAIEAHLADCAICRDRVARLHRVLAEARALPGEIAPPEDWWPTIRAAIDERKVIPLGGTAGQPAQPWWIRPRVLVAAAMLLVVASAGTTAVLMRSGTSAEGPGAVASSSTRPASPRLAAITANYEGLTRQLLADFERHRSALPPEAVAQVEQNLQIIDSAIREIVDVLESEPNNDVLLELLNTSYRQKLAVLEHAAESVS